MPQQMSFAMHIRLVLVFLSTACLYLQMFIPSVKDALWGSILWHSTLHQKVKLQLLYHWFTLISWKCLSSPGIIINGSSPSLMILALMLALHSSRRNQMLFLPSVNTWPIQNVPLVNPSILSVQTEGGNILAKNFNRSSL